MAKVLNGSINSTAYNGRYITLSWWAAQSISGNYSEIHWTLLGAGGSTTNWYEAGNFKVVIAGKTVYSSSGRINLYNGTKVAEGVEVVYHNTDGTKSFSASIEAGIYYVAVNCTGSGKWDLQDIPRAATITSAPNFNDEGKPKVQFSNPAGTSVDSLSIGIGTSSSSANLVGYKSLGKTATEYTFSFTSAEQQKLWGAVSLGTTTTVYFILKTTIGGTDYTNSLAKTLTLVNATPTVSPTVVDGGSVSTQITKDPSKIISGYNSVHCKANAAARKGATIKKVWIRNGSIYGEGTTTDYEKIFTHTTDGKFYFNAEDSRGNRITNAPYEVSKDLIPWFKPTITFGKNNMTTDGAYTVSASGTFYNGALGSTANSITVQYKWRESGGSWSDWTAMTVSKNGNNYSASASKSGLDYQTVYEVQIRAYDAIGAVGGIDMTYTREESVSSTPVFDWGKSSFQHNTSVYFPNNKGIYGTTTDGSSTLLLSCNGNNNLLLGYGGYTTEVGNTNIYGDSVNIKVKKNIKFNDVTIRDFIIEQGTSGIWNYRKWNSGYAELWGVVSVNTAVNTAWGSMYVGSTKMSRQGYPWTFKSQPHEMASVRSGSNAVWVYAESGGNGTNSTTQTAVYNICRPSAITSSSNYHILIQVAGYIS